MVAPGPLDYIEMRAEEYQAFVSQKIHKNPLPVQLHEIR